MTLNDDGLIEAIISIQDEMRNATDYEKSKQIYATKLMQAFKSYLLSGTITVDITGTSNQGAFTGTGTGTIS